MKSWDKIIADVIRLLAENGIKSERTGDVLHTNFCTIEFTGTPYKPEYWVNEVRISMLSGLVAAVENGERGDE